MFELRPEFDLTRFSLASGSGWLTLALLYALIWANVLFTVPCFIEGSRALAARYGRHMPRLFIHFESMAVVWPFAVGMIVGLFYFFDRDDFLWYVGDALTLWPDYGSATCWSVNVGLALLTINTMTLSVACVRIYNGAGCIAAVGFSALALGTFFAGILFGPLGLLVMLSRFTRGVIPDTIKLWRWAWGP